MDERDNYLEDSNQPDLDRNTSVSNVRVPTVSEDVAREALQKFVDSKCTYCSKPSRHLTFTDLQPIAVYRYRLETYTEERISVWTFESYTGQLVDGSENGSYPPPWDIPVSMPERYTDLVQKIRVPHSSFIKECHKCLGSGRTHCTHCHYSGTRPCLLNYGDVHTTMTNYRKNNTCPQCRERCSTCHGDGFRVCKACHCSKKLLHFIQLTVTWENNVTDFIPDRQPDFPDKKFVKVKGDPFFIDESVLVYPIHGFPDQEICDISSKTINEHVSQFSSNRRILQQRQTIELVPMTHAHYSYSGKDYDYYVYGMENKVYAPTYPSACTIL